MSDKEYDDQINVEVPSETKELAKEKLEFGGLKRVVNQALERVAYGEGVARKERLKEELAQLRDDREELKNERQKIDNKIGETERKMERKEEKLDNLRDLEGKYEAYLESLEADLKSGLSVFVGHKKVERAAELGDCTETEVVEELKERNPDMPQHLFTDTINTTSATTNKQQI